MPTLDPGEIVLRATSLRDSLQSSSIWAPSLSGASIDPAPIFVTCLQQPIMIGGGLRKPLPDYAIAQLIKSHGTTARFAFNSSTGEFLEAEGIKKAGVFLPRYVAVHTAAALLPAPLPAPDLVWQPCRESSNRFMPFWRYPVPGGTKYVRSDGIAYDALVIDVAG